MNKVSIIVVSYNELEYLPQCIDSCLSQFNKIEGEIIIGDDGSNDGSIDYIKNISNKDKELIKYFIQERDDEFIIPSIRVSNIIKKAIDISKGDYCLVISADDILLDNTFVSECFNFLENDINCDYSAVVANQFQKFWNDGQTELVKNKLLPPNLYWLGDYIHISCMLFRKKVAKQYILNRFCDDTGLQFSLLCGGKWKYVDKMSFGYRQRDKSIMHTADIFELNLLEVMLFQDCLNQKKKSKSLSFYSKSRFYFPLKYVYQNINKINDEKYMKYKLNSSMFNTDLLQMCKKNHIKIKIILIESFISRSFYYIQKHFIYR